MIVTGPLDLLSAFQFSLSSRGYVCLDGMFAISF